MSQYKHWIVVPITFICLMSCVKNTKPDNSELLTLFIDQALGNCAIVLKTSNSNEYQASLLPISKGDCKKESVVGLTTEENLDIAARKYQRALTVAQEIGPSCLNTADFIRARLKNPSVTTLFNESSSLARIKVYPVPDLLIESKKYILNFLKFNEHDFSSSSAGSLEQSKRLGDIVLLLNLASDSSANEPSCYSSTTAKLSAEFPTDKFSYGNDSRSGTKTFLESTCYYGSGLSAQEMEHFGCATLSEEF
ncbi:hypothetical protein CH373_04090 [Leptospira perolatii]|uniref:Uncharacterized protein n=1 Tax=Leptospira perolatii TaxID=2023191 RepID=A0A2M9ZPW0_9LEPT|nr:hypothetical protein [Leptospira perolatii]PJZ69019.1 hypothetical protein CH360_13240 [Leptospira perolatii]PJZ74112.1 hypothetical protein CH373_04090 [Leptospira perolatii]